METVLTPAPLALELAPALPDFAGAREGSVWTDVGGHVCGRSYIDRDRRWLDWFDTAVLEFRVGSPVVRVWPASGVTLDDVDAEFDRILRSIVLQAQGWQALHAGAALTADGALVFCGPSGAGKSTTAFALGQIGWRQLADDQVVWRAESGRPMMRTLPFAPRLRGLSQVHLAGPAAPTAEQPERDELLPIAGIFLLEQREGRDRPVSIMRLSPPRAFSSLLPHAHCFDVNAVEATRSLTTDYLTVAQAIPVFELSYSPDLERLPELMHAIVSSAAAVHSHVPAPVHVRAR
jgi:hypothetical protein